MHKIDIWDLPLRIFHWSMVVVVIAAISTALVGGNAMEWHGYFGLSLFGLIAFRLAWGVLGTRTARFSSFVRGPSAITAYLRGQWHDVGHNPLGALSVLALLGLFGFQALSGLFTNDDIAFNGPLRKLVDKATSDAITGLHLATFEIMLALIALHIGAILFYRLVRRDNLVTPMLRGWKESPTPVPGNTPVKMAALVVSLLFAGVCVWIADGGLLPDPPPVQAKPAAAPAW